MKKNHSKPQQLKVKPVLPNNVGELSLLKEETLIWIFTIVSALFVYLVSAKIIQSAYTPDVSLLKAAADKLLIAKDIARPEPMEATLFRVAVVIIPLSLLVFYRLFSTSKPIRNFAKTPLALILSMLFVFSLCILIYFDFAANNPFSRAGGDVPQIRRDHTSVTNFDFYFQDLFLGDHLVIYTFILVPLICGLFFLGMNRYNWENNKIYKIITGVAGYTILAAVIGSCLVMSTFCFPYQSENKYDFNAVYYSMTQVYAGAPLLINGFTNTYGLYPHFLNLIFQVIGLSVFKFSLVMALLIGISFTLNFYCLKQFVQNKAILFLGILTVIFFPFLDFKFNERFDAGFAFHAIRYIIPSVLLFLATVYLKNKSKKNYWATFVTLAFFVLWNPEFGIVSYLAWLMFNTYLDFYNKGGRTNLKGIGIHWLAGSGVLVFAFYFYKCLIGLFYGSFPDMSLLWTSMVYFGKLGFGLLPMTLVHPWNIVALILTAGFLFAIAKWYKKEHNPADAMIFLLSALGVGFFFYFQGRSHNWNFAQSSGMAIMLLTILGDKLWGVIKDKNILPLNALFTIFLFLISFSFFEIVTNTGKIYELLNQDEDKATFAAEKNAYEKCKEFVLNNSKPGQKINVLTLRKFQGFYFDVNKLRSGFNPGLIDLFSKSDLVKMENQFRDSSFSIFITPESFLEMAFMARPIAAIAATYEYSNRNEYMTHVEKRTIKIPTNVIFGKQSDLVFYRKYNDDSAGENARINDAFGTKPLNLPQDFSVEVIFDAKNQVFPFATLIANLGDSSGFSFSRVLDSAKCIFTVNGTGYLVPVPVDGWIYCVLSLFTDHFEVYLNGNLVSYTGLSRPFRNSKNPLCVGNLGNLHNYVGAISEVAITNKALDSIGVRETWNEILRN